MGDSQNHGGALAGFTVLDLTQGLSGPFCSMRLGDAGADVVKVEPPLGDALRGSIPRIHGESAHFLALNRNKRSIALDTDSAEGRAVLAKLAGKADVVLMDHNSAASTALDPVQLREANPAVVLCSISPFGEQGPLKDQPGSELVVQAMADYLNSLGRIGEAPVRVGTDIASLNTGIFASQGITAALFHRLRTGEGQRVEVSLLGTLINMRGLLWTCLCNPDEWFGVFNDSYVKEPDSGYRTTTGRVFWGLRRGDSEDWDRLVIELGLLDYMDDPRFADYGRAATSIGRYAPEVKPIWEKAFIDRGMTREDVIALVLEIRGDAVPFSDYDTLLAHPQVKTIGAIRQVETASGEKFDTVAPGTELSATPNGIHRPPPALGQHTDELLAQAGFTNKEIASFHASGVVI